MCAIIDSSDSMTMNTMVENRYVRDGLTPESFRWAFTTTHTAYWHPLTWLSHMWMSSFTDESGRPPPDQSALSHSEYVLLFYVLRRMTVISCPVALWPFICSSPINVESSPGSRTEKPPVCFFLVPVPLGVCTYAENRGWEDTCRCCYFSVGSDGKTMIVTLPFVLLLLDYWPLNRFRLEKIIHEKIPLFILSAVSSVVTCLGKHQIGAVRSFEEFANNNAHGNAMVSYALTWEN